MKFRQQFDVNESVSKVWTFFDQPALVAECIPGIESVSIVDANTLSVRVRQNLGPLSATFESRVHISDKVHQERIQFTSTGKAVRGAIGNFRVASTVMIEPAGDRITHVIVEGEAALAGALGSVGQKVIAKQADRVTGEFAENLEQALLGGETQLHPVASPTTGAASRPGRGRDALETLSVGTRGTAAPAVEFWAKVCAALSAATLMVSLMILFQLAG